MSRLVYSMYSLTAWSVYPLFLRIFHLRKCCLKSLLFSSTVGTSFAGASLYGLLGSFFSSATIFSSLATWAYRYPLSYFAPLLQKKVYQCLKTIHDSFQYISFSVALHQLQAGGTSQIKTIRITNWMIPANRYTRPIIPSASIISFYFVFILIHI